MINDIFNILLPQCAIGFTIILLIILSMILPIKSYKFARIISLVGIAFAIVFLSFIHCENTLFYNTVSHSSCLHCFCLYSENYCPILRLIIIFLLFIFIHLRNRILFCRY